MNHNLKPCLLFTLIFLIILYSCAEHDIKAVQTQDCNSSNEVSFNGDVHSIIETKCSFSGCHNGDNGAGLNWQVFSNLQANASDIKDRITRPPGAAGHMPQVGSLSQEQINSITCWVDQGAKNN